MDPARPPARTAAPACPQDLAAHPVLVVGNLNLDRILRLDAPLRSGGRIGFSPAQTRRGGGGFNTARALRALGRATAICAPLARDPAGDAWIEALRAMGIDVAHVSRREGSSTVLELLIEPDGERTILAPAQNAAFRAESFPLPAAWPGAVYFNAGGCAPEAVSRLGIAPWIAAQAPLQPGRQMPADLLITSRDDAGRDDAGRDDAGRDDAGRDASGRPLDEAELWSRAVAIAGARLSELLITDGPRAVTLIRRTPTGGREALSLPVAPGARPADTVGAGDFFAGGYVDARLRGLSPEAAVLEAGALALRLLGAGPILA